MCLRRIRIARRRDTTAHLCSTYPFLAGSIDCVDGAYLGTDGVSGAAFAFDPFDYYALGLLTNPNVLIAGEVGAGKSTMAKTFINRAVGVFGRWVAIADPKGEYLPLADKLGLSVIALRPGGGTRVNPLDPGPAVDPANIDDVVRRQSSMLVALLESVLRRDLQPFEDAALGSALVHLARQRALIAPTLHELLHVLADPPRAVHDSARSKHDGFVDGTAAMVHGLGKLLDRSLRGMFDGPTSAQVDWSGRGVVLDLSGVHHDPDALALVLVAATAWLQAFIAAPDDRPKLQVFDEAWTLLGSERTSKYLQSCWKLSRAYGVANVAIVHRLSDLRAQADDGTTAAKVSMGLLADTQTRVLFRQSSDQVREATELLGLTSREAELLPQLAKGRALWKFRGATAVVAHFVGPDELDLCDTDARMRR
jgi:type IV secretory pathway VirB4 component